MFVPLFPFPVPIPLIREQLLPPNRPAPPAAPRLDSRECASPDPVPTSTNTARAEGGGIQRGCSVPPWAGASRGPGGVPGEIFGDFLLDEKVTRVQGGAPASGEAGDSRPA